MKTRTDLLNHLAETYNLERYLEIGVQDPKQNFDQVDCPYKISVDPDPKAGATFQCTSDSFFEWISKYSNGDEGPVTPETRKLCDIFVRNENLYKNLVSFGVDVDLIFIDGLHTAEQLKKDFDNALKILSPNGFIVLHDCNPEKEEHTIVPRPTERGHWNGDVYKFAATIVNASTVDIDNGLLIFRNAMPVYRDERIRWDRFNENRKQLLNLISWDEFITTYSHV
jgi:hypothetical protein